MYIGTQPYSGIRARHTYTATAGQTSFSGAGAENVTLTYADELYIDVYQNGVKLSPADYTATSGTTVVLGTGATVSDIIEVIKYDAFSVADTVSAKDGGSFGGNVAMAGDLTVDTSTLKVDSTNNRVGIGNASPNANTKLDVNGAARIGNNTDGIMIENNTGTFDIDNASYIRRNSSSGALEITSGSTTARNMIFNTRTNGAVSMTIDSTGAVTMPLQPAFQAIPASSQSNFAVGVNVTVVFGTEIFDQNADFASNTFTAPVTGKYQLQATLRVQTLDSASAYYYMLIKTSNRQYINIVDPDYGQDNVYITLQLAALADMDANDTAFIQIYQASGAVQTDINNDSSFSGYLVA